MRFTILRQIVEFSKFFLAVEQFLDVRVTERPEEAIPVGSRAPNVVVLRRQVPDFVEVDLVGGVLGVQGGDWVQFADEGSGLRDLRAT